MRRIVVVAVCAALLVSVLTAASFAQQSGAPDQEGGGMRGGGMEGGMGGGMRGMHGGMMGGMSCPMHSIFGGPAIAISADGIYVIAGGMLLKYDRDLNLLKRVELPIVERKRMAEMQKACSMMGQGQQMGGGMQGMTWKPPAQARWSAELMPMPGIDSNTSGMAWFWTSPDGGTLFYRIDVASMMEPTQAHVHMAAPGGGHGEPIVPLFDGKKTGEFSGTLASGTATEGDLIGRIKGKKISDLVDAMKAGETVVIVHSTRYPNGELMGVVK